MRAVVALGLLLAPSARAEEDGEDEEGTGGWSGEQLPSSPAPTPPADAPAPPADAPAPPADAPSPPADVPEVQNSPAADDDWGDEADTVGFADTPAPEEAEPQGFWERSPVRPGGILRTDEAVWLERLDGRPWAKARQTVDLWLRYSQGRVRAKAAGHAEIDLVYLGENKDSWDQGTLDEYRSQLRPDELWASVAAGPFDLSAGRQVVAWGEGFFFSPVDVVNPRDLREPGLADLDDVRLPVAMLRLGWFQGGHRVEAMVVPETHFGFRPTPQGPFGPFDALLARATNPLVAEILPGKTFRYDEPQEGFEPETWGRFARWSYKGQGLDLAVYGASLLEKQGTIELPEPAEFLDSDDLVVVLRHRRYEVFGTSGARPWGDVLTRWEVAWERGRFVDTADLEATLPEIVPVEADLVDVVVSAGYAGLARTTLDLEVAKNTFLGGPPEDMLFPLDTWNGGLRATHHLFRERLDLEAVGTAFDLGRLGWLGRASASYELRDGLRAKLGVITYRPPEDEISVFLGLDRHDRLFGQVRWDF